MQMRMERRDEAVFLRAGTLLSSLDARCTLVRRPPLLDGGRSPPPFSMPPLPPLSSWTSRPIKRFPTFSHHYMWEHGRKSLRGQIPPLLAWLEFGYLRPLRAPRRGTCTSIPRSAYSQNGSSTSSWMNITHWMPGGASWAYSFGLSQSRRYGVILACIC